MATYQYGPVKIFVQTTSALNNIFFTLNAPTPWVIPPPDVISPSYDENVIKLYHVRNDYKVHPDYDLSLSLKLLENNLKSAKLTRSYNI